MTAIVDYNAGNLRSVLNMLLHLGYRAHVAERPEQLEGAEKIILPGVGKFDFGMTHLEERGFIQALHQKVAIQKTPLLGICLGAQLLTNRSDEGRLPGLGWIPGETVAFDRTRLGPADRVPHMGWTDTDFRSDSRLANGLDSSSRYYYVHSYHLRCENTEDELCHAVHGYRFVAGVEKGNILGVQFHPEKSHRFGMQILRNFIENY